MRVVFLLCLVLIMLVGVCEGKMIYVPDDYAKIQWAVDNASAGDVIVVRNGTYKENIIVDKPLTIKSENGPSSTIVQAFNLTSDNVKIIGFKVCEGIVIYYANGSVFKNNTILGNFYGRCAIYLCNSNNSAIENNNILKSITGIYLWCSNDNIIENNNILDNQECGIGIDFSSNSIIENNNILNNGFYGIYLWNSNYSTIENNNISNNWCGIGLHNSNNNVIYLNKFYNNTNNADIYNSTNIWNSTGKIMYEYDGKTFTNYLGNYWSNYSGKDINGDGIGDSPYVIDSHNVDYHPLISPSITIVSKVKIKEPWQKYDINGNGRIDDLELLQSIQDWLNNKLNDLDLLNIIMKWLKP